MESAFAALSASSPSLKFSRFSSRNPNPSFRSNSNLSFSRNLDSISIHHPVSSFSRSPFLPFGTWISASSLDRRRNDVSVEASSVSESAGDVSNVNSSFIETAKLGFLIVVWYLFNIYFNIVNKQILKVYPYPITISALQYAIGAALSVLMCSFNLYEKPKIKTSQLVAILPLAIGHTLGNLFTNVSLVKVSVSFTHTIKAMEPFFTVILSALFLGEMPTLWVVSSLVPIVGGVVLASATEASFDWVGFWSAMVSNLTNQSRNVFSKKLMADKEESLDNITIFSIITIMSFFLTVPVTLYMEGIIFTPSYLQSLGLNVREIYMQFLLGGILYHAYQQISYMILQKVSPVTHSVSNSVKRVVVIVASVLFFRTPVSPINSLGTGVALLGVFLYSRVKQIKPKPKTM